MEEIKIQRIMQILTKWNPLKDKAKEIKDLDNYRTEAIDIVSTYNIFCGKDDSFVNLVKDILNQAFDITLSNKDCKTTAKKILKVINYKSTADN